MNRMRIILSMVLIFLFCGQVFGLVNPRGSGETHDIATWNLENFPLNENLTVNYLTLLINDLDLDLICVQEIQSVDDFQQLVSNLRGWDGIITPGEISASIQRKGFSSTRKRFP